MTTENKINSFRIRASYPNYYMVKLYADYDRFIFEKKNEREGNKPGTVIFTLTDDDTQYEIAPKWYDIFYLLNKQDTNLCKHYLWLLIEERDGNKSVIEELESLRNNFLKRCKDYVKDNPLYDDQYIVSTLTQQNFSEIEISNKGKMLLELTRQCYAVPDFCILSSEAFKEENQEPLLRKAIHNLEIMTMCKLGDSKNPLVFALRSAMPQYIPGLMPTLLNIGINRTAYQALSRRHGVNMGNRIYLNTLSNLFDMLSIDDVDNIDENKLSTEKQFERIAWMESKIIEKEGNDRLLTDSFHQTLRLTMYVRDFYITNKDLVLTFMRGKHAYPSLIMHKMVWTIGNDSSYPGVLYSRHSRTGLGRQIESFPDIFGEEIMTGNITAVDIEYFDRVVIREQYPAVYHFDPLLINLEKRFKSPVTIEFGVETIPGKASLFAVLQLNRSELTGRAALLSSIEMYTGEKISNITWEKYKNDEYNKQPNPNKIINKKNLIELIRPYHLRQIFSDAIDDKSFKNLTFFCNGINVLPRSATTARICFSASSANLLKKEGYPVCLCKERFTPEDTIVLNEVDAIMSMTPAAIHVVTACRGYGIPAFINLQLYGTKIMNKTLVNDKGVIIEEFEWITVSSRRQSIYKGKASYTPARFRKYLDGEKLELTEKEKPVFRNLKIAYEIYRDIITTSQVNFITDIDSLARLINYDLNKSPEKARRIANEWYNLHPDLYEEQVLESRMGSHKEQSMVFELLDNDKKVNFFKNAISKCKVQNLSGLQAGAFMLGRFLAKPLPKVFWTSFDSREIAFMLNEYVLYEKYLSVLQEVGETKLTKAHSKIISEGLKELELRNISIDLFIPLMFCNIDWDEVEIEVNKLNNRQNNTLFVTRKLSSPVEEVFDLSKPWVKDKVDKLKTF